MADFEDENFDADEQSGAEAAEEDALYLAEEVDTDDEGDEDAGLPRPLPPWMRSTPFPRRSGPAL